MEFRRGVKILLGLAGVAAVAAVFSVFVLPDLVGNSKDLLVYFFLALGAAATVAAGVAQVWDTLDRLREEQDRKPAIPEGPAVGEVQADQEEMYERYLRHLMLVSNELRLTAVDRKAATRPETAELELSEVFTSLDVMETADQPDEESARSERGRSERTLRLEREEKRRSAIVALAEHPRLVLLGEPGSGKTTLVRFVSVCLAGEGLGLADLNARRLGEGWQLPRLTPLRVVLRDYAARGLPQGLGLWAFIAGELERTETETGGLAPFVPLLRRRLERQAGLLLMDGLDEVPDAHRQREQLKAAVERFAVDFPLCRILVTSRPYAYQNAEWHLTGFGVRRLVDFSAEQVQEFITRWYRHIAARDPAFGSDNAERYAAQLQHAVQTRPRLAELAPRPLLLTLMASLHRWRHGGALPDKREELYDESVKLLIDLWQRPKLIFDAQGNPASEEYDVWTELRISPDNLRQGLEKVAFEAHRDQPTATGTHDIPVDRLAGALYQASDDRANISIDRVCSYVRDRTGLLVDRGADVFAFPHRTFQEYLAACHLTNYGFPRELARLCRADDERWREALLLAAAKAARGTSDSVWRLAEALCPGEVGRVADPRDPDWRAALRAAQALIETEQHQRVEEWDRDKLERLRGWLVAMLEAGALPPPDRAAGGRALAHLGDPRPGVGLRPDSLPELVWCDVPAGPFLMGSSDADRRAYSWEKPQHEVSLPAFRIAKYPVTQAQFGAFVAAEGYGQRRYWTPQGWQWKERQGRTGPDAYGDPFDLPNHPAVGVSWYEALACCAWLTEVWRAAGVIGAGEAVRLPSEAEWEKAARGPSTSSGQGRIYPWGDAFDAARCNADESGIGATSAVGIFPGGASPCGALDMAGNVWEWTSSLYRAYPYRADDGREDLQAEGDAARVLRGGAWYSDQRFARSACRDYALPHYRNYNSGFRCCLAATSSLSGSGS